MFASASLLQLLASKCFALFVELWFCS